MEFEKQLKLQAHLDGELSEKEAREVTRWLAQDQEAVLLQAELRHTRAALKGAEGFVLLPESREFFWSKIKRQIEREEPAPLVADERSSWLTAWRRLLIPASAIAVLAIAALIAIGPIQFEVPIAPEAESHYTDTGAFTYRDYAARATLVWLSYPADNDVADNDAADTVQ